MMRCYHDEGLTCELCKRNPLAFGGNGDPTQRADEVAEKMRAYYEAHRPPTLFERVFAKRRWDRCTADNLMLGLLMCAQEHLNADSALLSVYGGVVVTNEDDGRSPGAKRASWIQGGGIW